MSRPFLSQQSTNVITLPPRQDHRDRQSLQRPTPGLQWNIKTKQGMFNNINTDQELFSEICYHIILLEFVVECEKRETSQIPNVSATQNYSPKAFVNVNNIGHVFHRKLTVRGPFNSDLEPIKKSVILCTGEIDSAHSYKFGYYEINYQLNYIILV